MSTDSPFAAPPPKDLSPIGGPSLLGPAEMQYMRAYNYIFENPNWMTNVLWGLLCVVSTAVIPILGQIVFLGYTFDVIEMLLVTRDSRYPDFDTNRLSDYLMRGLWASIVQLAILLMAMAVLIPLVLVGIGLSAAAASAVGDEAGGIVFGLGFFLVFVAGFVASMGLGILVVPFTLRAGLSQNLSEGFNFGWAKDFIRRVWTEALLATLFMYVTSMLLLSLGMLALCVGYLFVLPIVFFASAHIQYQLYNLYLSRGGEPIPLKPRLPPVMMQPVAPQ